MDRTTTEVLSDWMSSSSTGPPAAGILAPTTPTPARHIGLTTEVVLTLSYVVGIAGNLAALVILVRGGRGAHRNRRHSLMLRCLACNDLVALLGMLVMMESQLRLPRDLARSRFFCGLRVVWRLFGLGSGSVALVMALERWLALTRPFFYHKHVTYHVVRRAIFSMWSCVLLLVLLPLAGFGLYYDPVSCTCARYPRATKPIDIAYAYVYFTFGMLLITSILCCNLLVARRLYNTSHSQPALIRRISRRAVKLQHADSHDSATHEETAFAKLMGFLCVLFVLCWLPQMISIPLTQLWPGWPPGQRFVRVADFSLLLHFTLDPFVYVLQRCTRRKMHGGGAPPPAAALGPAASVQPLLLRHGEPGEPQPQQPQSYIKKLGASLRLCGCGCSRDLKPQSICCSTPTQPTPPAAPRPQVLHDGVAL